MRQEIKEVRAAHPEVVKKYRDASARTNRESRTANCAGRRAAAQGSHVLRRPLRHLGRIDPARQPPRAIRASSAQERTGRSHARVHHPGNFPRTEHARREGERRAHFATCRRAAKPSWKKSANKSKTLSKQFTRYGILFVVSAPSGAGKDHALRCFAPDTGLRLLRFLHHAHTAAGRNRRRRLSFPGRGGISSRGSRAGEFLEHARRARALSTARCESRSSQQSEERRGRLDRYRYSRRRSDP